MIPEPVLDKIRKAFSVKSCFYSPCVWTLKEVVEVRTSEWHLVSCSAKLLGNGRKFYLNGSGYWKTDSNYFDGYDQLNVAISEFNKRFIEEEW